MLVKRKLYFNEQLEDGGAKSDDDTWPGDVEECKRANLIGSLCEDGLHRPVLDLDINARLWSSSTEGHFHLLLDGVALSWEAYQELLAALAKAGVITEAYRKHSIERGMTFIRTPDCKKRPREEQF